MNPLSIALDQMQASRAYTLKLLDDTPAELWFCRPAEGVTHLAWQVGHLAVAQFRLGLVRLRGPREEDGKLLPEAYVERFAIRSVPSATADDHPSREELLTVLERVNEQVMREAPTLPESQWDQSAGTPHPEFHTKLGALFWCSRHEMLHAGQIGLLRRLLGCEPRW
jgi:hypothetical protein